MRLDASVFSFYQYSQYLHFISQEQLRVLTSIELGMRNHEWVPSEVIARIAKLRGGQCYKVLRKLLKNKFIVHTGKIYDGYKLAYLGYDYLALQTFIKRGILKDVICKIGVGKQSDIYKCITPEGEQVVLKLTRLGRNSFRSVKKNRQYIGNRTNYNWLYLSRLSSIRQFLFMQLLHQNKFQTPKPIDTNRHAIVMSLVEGEPLCHIQRIDSQEQIKIIFEKARAMLIELAKNGLIHGDYNQFNLITNLQGTKLTVIDFPQCISINHPNADTYFDRDVECIYKYFDKMVERQLSDNKEEFRVEGDLKKNKFVLNVADYPLPVLKQIQIIRRLDHQIKTKGHITLTEEKQLEKARLQSNQMKSSEDLQQDQSQQGEELENKQQDEQDSQQQLDQQNQEQNQQALAQNQHGGRQLKKMSFDHTEGQLEQISTHQNANQHGPQQIYDKQLQQLMSQLNYKNLQPQFSENPLENPFEQPQSQQQQAEHPEFIGLTAFQIRQKIKEQKRIQREKRKKQMSEQQFIKNAVKRSTKRFNNNQTNNLQGNRGNKKKNKMNSENIKFGYEMM